MLQKAFLSHTHTGWRSKKITTVLLAFVLCMTAQNEPKRLCFYGDLFAEMPSICFKISNTVSLTHMYSIYLTTICVSAIECKEEQWPHLEGFPIGCTGMQQLIIGNTVKSLQLWCHHQILDISDFMGLAAVKKMKVLLQRPHFLQGTLWCQTGTQHFEGFLPVKPDLICYTENFYSGSDFLEVGAAQSFHHSLREKIKFSVKEV